MKIDSFSDIADQLRCPSGSFGKEIGKRMNKSNRNMIHKTFASMQLKGGEKILELGHGMGTHISELFSLADDLIYTGLDVSSLMHKDAQQNNLDAVENGRATFHLYDGENLPSLSTGFDKVFLVNTIYFVQNPLDLFMKLSSICKARATIHIAFVSRSFMEKMPFAENGFRLFGVDELTEIINLTPFYVQEIEEEKEVVLSNTGKTLERDFSILTAFLSRKMIHLIRKDIKYDHV